MSEEEKLTLKELIEGWVESYCWNDIGPEDLMKIFEQQGFQIGMTKNPGFPDRYDKEPT